MAAGWLNGFKQLHICISSATIPNAGRPVRGSIQPFRRKVRGSHATEPKMKDTISDAACTNPPAKPHAAPAEAKTPSTAKSGATAPTTPTASLCACRRSTPRRANVGKYFAHSPSAGRGQGNGSTALAKRLPLRIIRTSTAGLPACRFGTRGQVRKQAAHPESGSAGVPARHPHYENRSGCAGAVFARRRVAVRFVCMAD